MRKLFSFLVLVFGILYTSYSAVNKNTDGVCVGGMVSLLAYEVCFSNG